MSRKKKYDKPGFPVNHPPVRIVELDEVYKTYDQVASRIGGQKGNIYLCLIGDRTSHKGFTFEYVVKKDKEL